jgi:hypothetical protein
VPDEILPVQIATDARRFAGFTRNQPGCPQALELRFVLAASLTQDLLHRGAHLFRALQIPQQAAQVIAERSIVFGRDFFQLRQSFDGGSQTVKCLPDQIRLATQEVRKLCELARCA